MNELECFLSKLNAAFNKDSELSIEESRKVICEINSFLFTNYDGIGTTEELGDDYEYFSEFHKYWKQHHKEILDIQIDDANCEKVADVLHSVYVKTNGKAFSDVYDINGLSKDEVCRVRFLTANQDFRGSRSFKDYAKLYKTDPDLFEPDFIVRSPELFIEKIGATQLSQTDKRVSYAKKISEFLISRAPTPFDLITYYKGDVYTLRQEMIECQGAGYGNKKTDMFIRDMVVLNIWNNVSGFEKIDVASDVNTIKVALRTGIMTCAIPLVSSFLDMFCYQYSYVDEMNAKAWRRVWEIWNDKYQSEVIASPALLDYFIYRLIGKEFCKVSIYTYECENGHIFDWRNKAKSICGKCKTRAHVISGKYVCDKEDGTIVVSQYLPDYSNCPLKDICDCNNKKILQPPKSISILGRTGWTTAYARENAGGGGLMA